MFKIILIMDSFNGQTAAISSEFLYLEFEERCAINGG